MIPHAASLLLESLFPAESRIAAPSPAERLKRATIAHTCRRIPREAMAGLVEAIPGSGDLVLARVETLGRHQALERNGQRLNLWPGDEIVVCYGDQDEAELPGDLDSCHLITAGGMAARLSPHRTATEAPTVLTPLGLIADAKGRPLNLADGALKPRLIGSRIPALFAVIGTATNAGETRGADLIHGLAGAGLKVGAARITGTGTPRAIGSMRDAGASPVYDCTDAGVASTCRLDPREIERIFVILLSQIAAAGVDAMVFELAGLDRQETAALLRSPCFAQAVDGVLFAAREAREARAGIEWLRRLRLPVLGVAGLPTGEAPETLDVPVVETGRLRDPDAVRGLGFVKRPDR